MNLTPKKAWTLAAGYIGLIYVGLYFTPFLSTFLKERELLVSFINYSYLLAGAFLFFILYFIFHILKTKNYRITIFLCFLVAVGDEAIQGLLPNREAEWNDFWANVFAYYLAAGLVGIVEYFRPHYGKAG